MKSPPAVLAVGLATLGLIAVAAALYSQHSTPSAAEYPAPAMTMQLERRSGPAPDWYHAHRRLSRSQFVPVHNEPAEGYYWSYVAVGTPPQPFSVILDTGSGVMGIPGSDCPSCGRHMDPKYNPDASSTSSVVGCGSKCHASCNARTSTCHYETAYAEGSRLAGTFYEDMVRLGTSVDAPAVDYQFGVNSLETKLFVTQTADGILGLSKRANTLLSAMYAANVMSTNVFTLCLSETGGQFVVGGVNTSLHDHPPVYTPMGGIDFYNVNLQRVQLGSTQLSVVSSAWTQGTGCIVDSGTTFTYMPAAAMTELKRVIGQACDGESSCKSTRVPGEHTCFTYSAASVPKWPTMKLVFSGATLNVPGRLYMAHMNDHTSCIGIYGNGADGTVIGANIMRGYDVIFDVSRRRVGFAASGCTSPVADCPTCLAETNDVDDPPAATNWIIAVVAGAIVAILGCIFICCRCNKSNKQHWEPVGTEDDDEAAAAGTVELSVIAHGGEPHVPYSDHVEQSGDSDVRPEEHSDAAAAYSDHSSHRVHAGVLAAHDDDDDDDNNDHHHNEDDVGGASDSDNASDSDTDDDSDGAEPADVALEDHSADEHSDDGRP